MNRVLFVCHGNICRSPMAEFVLKDLVEQRGVEDQFEIASAAAHTDEIGNDVYPPIRKIMDKHGVPYEPRQARLLKKSDEIWDYIIGMDDANVRDIRRKLGRAVDGRVFKLLEFAGSKADVSDPWYTRDFETCYQDILGGCEAFLGSLGY